MPNLSAWDRSASLLQEVERLRAAYRSLAAVSRDGAGMRVRKYEPCWCVCARSFSAAPFDSQELRILPALRMQWLLRFMLGAPTLKPFDTLPKCAVAQLLRLVRGLAQKVQINVVKAGPHETEQLCSAQILEAGRCSASTEKVCRRRDASAEGGTALWLISTCLFNSFRVPTSCKINWHAACRMRAMCVCRLKS